MVETTSSDKPVNADTAAVTDAGDTATPKAKFAKAIDEAKSGAQALAHEAQERAGAYREQIADKSGEWLEEAKAVGEQAKERAAELASEGKARASDAIAGLGKMVAESAGTLDEKLGPKYGEYARTAARTIQDTAARIEAKDLNELGDDAREFVRKSPALAVGIAATVGFMFARIFRSKS